MAIPVVLGWRPHREKVGRAADFCPFCRAVRSVAVSHVVSRGHIYYIPLGPERVEAADTECETCRGRQLMTQYPYPTLSYERGAALEALIHETNPNLEQTWARRLDLEQRAQLGKINEEERNYLIRNPFLTANAWIDYETRIGTHRLRLRLALSLLIGVIMLALLGPRAGAPLWNTLLGLALAAAGLYLGALLTRPQRFIRKRVHPALVRALSPFKPTYAELDRALAHLGDGGRAASRWIKTRPLFRDIEAAQGLAFAGELGRAG